MKINHSTTLALLGSITLTLSTPTVNAQVVRSGVGADAAAIQGTVDAFRTDLGVNNGVGPLGVGGTPGVGRREINWDAVPDALSSPASFPGNFFNQPSGSPAGRVRGAVFTTAGTFEVSADADSDGDGNPGPVSNLFGNRNIENPPDFGAFSAERIFGINGANEMDVRFAIPGSPGVAAGVRGFGAIFTDVETAGDTRLEFYDINGILLTQESAQPFVFAGPDSGKSFSFLGISFADPIVYRVRIRAGSFDLSLNPFGGGLDAVAMDDFIYGEPFAAPDLGSTAALLMGGLGLCWIGRRTRQA